MHTPTPGQLYTHYKNSDLTYEIIGISIHTETDEEMVIYKSLYETDTYPYGTLWARPLSMFTEHVEINGATIPRFALKKA